MNRYKVVTLSEFKDLYWRRFGSFLFAKNTAIVSIVFDELNRSVTEFPLAFMRQADSYQLTAVLGLQENTNLFISADGAWAGNYAPAVLRSYPFVSLQDKEGNLVLCIDSASGLIVSEANGAERFFLDDGSPTESIKQISGFLRAIHAQQLQTRELCNQLAGAGLLKPCSYTESGRTLNLEGLYQLDMDTLARLDADSLKTIRDSGALQLAYGQLFSMSNFSKLLARETSVEKSQSKQTPELSFDVADDSQTLNFDNI